MCFKEGDNLSLLYMRVEALSGSTPEARTIFQAQKTM